MVWEHRRALYSQLALPEVMISERVDKRDTCARQVGLYSGTAILETA